jgi:O-antigen/teichoic acid export membrane protein
MALLVVMLPRYLTMADYGYWQLYFFYATYLGYLSFGLADGIFLRFSGSRLEEIPRSVVAGHFQALLVIASVTLGVGVAVAWALVPDRTTTAIIALACVSTLFYLLRSLLTFAHQAANRMELFATATVLERLVGLAIAVVLLLVGYRDLVGFLLADVVGRAIGLGYAMVSAREFVFAPRLSLAENIREIRESFRGGIFLNVSAIATVLVTAVGRLSAERGYGIEVFGQVALAFSLVNIVQTVVASISIAVLPNIRRYPRTRLAQLFSRGLNMLMPLLVLSLLAYVPLAWFIGRWVPTYTLLPLFLGAMMPMVIFESRTRLFAIPFLQGVRWERALAAINIVSLLLATMLAWGSVAVLGSPLATVLSVTVAVVIRSIALEWATSRALGLGRRGRTAAELGVSVLFIVAATSTVGWTAWLLFSIAWVSYLWWSRPALRELFALLLQHRQAGTTS